VALAAAFCLPAGAQRRRAGQVAVSGPPGTRVIRTSQPLGTTSLPGSTVSGLSFDATGGNSVTALIGGVPGFGFDYTHLAARNRNLDVRALIDPVTQHRLALARQIRRETPVVPVGPLLFNVTQVVVFPQPPVVIVQSPPAEEPERPEPVRYVVREPETPARPPDPPRELSELVFVRRDGGLIFAVAFTAQRDRIVYVTREGHRRSLLLDDLDLETTLQFNEERGTTLRLPA
jgi:hypothetical protein